MNIEYLKKVGITHVLNTAEGSMFATVDTSAEYYKEAGIKYLGLQLLDTPSANISQYFEQGADFIESCLNAGGLLLPSLTKIYIFLCFMFNGREVFNILSIPILSFLHIQRCYIFGTQSNDWMAFLCCRKVISNAFPCQNFSWMRRIDY